MRGGACLSHTLSMRESRTNQKDRTRQQEVGMSKDTVLVLGSNANKIEIRGGTGKTGQYLNETVIPVWAVKEAGFNVVLATPDGTQPHIDEASRSAAHFGGNEATF